MQSWDLSACRLLQGCLSPEAPHTVTDQVGTPVPMSKGWETGFSEVINFFKLFFICIFYITTITHIKRLHFTFLLISFFDLISFPLFLGLFKYSINVLPFFPSSSYHLFPGLALPPVFSYSMYSFYNYVVKACWVPGIVQRVGVSQGGEDLILYPPLQSELDLGSFTSLSAHSVLLRKSMWRLPVKIFL